MYKTQKRTSKFLKLAILLVAVLALSGCRTRISNNSEVSNVYYDETGFLQESYEMRRDELGLSTAEKPILPDFGTPEEDDSDMPDEADNLGPIEEEEEPEPYVEPPQTNTNTNTNSNSSNTTTRRTTRTTPSRRSTTPSTTTTTYKVQFDPTKDGTIKGKSKGAVQATVKAKNSTVSAPSVEARDGYTFGGWKNGNTTIKAGDSVKVTKNITYTAQWTKNEEPAAVQYTIKLYGDGGGDTEEKVNENGSYTLPLLTKEGYIHKSWTTNQDGSGTTYDPKEVVKSIKADLTLYAQWEDVYDHWSKELEDVDLKPKTIYIVNGDGDLHEGCGLDPSEGDTDLAKVKDAEYLVVTSDNLDKEAIKALIEEKAGEDTELLDELKKKKVIAVSDKALSTDAETWLLDKITLIKKIHNKLDPGKAAKDLGRTADEIKIEDKLWED